MTVGVCNIEKMISFNWKDVTHNDIAVNIERRKWVFTMLFLRSSFVRIAFPRNSGDFSFKVLIFNNVMLRILMFWYIWKNLIGFKLFVLQFVIIRSHFAKITYIVGYENNVVFL